LITLDAEDADDDNVDVVRVGELGEEEEEVVLGTLERLRRVGFERYSFLDLVVCVGIVLLLGLFGIGLLMTGDKDCPFDHIN